MQASLIIPCFNEGPVIDRTVERSLEAMGEHFTEFEIIFCNDGSKDDTEAKLEAHAARSRQVRVVSYDVNRGAGYAFARGLEAARGEMVLHSDADLAIDPSAVIPLFMAEIVRHDIVLASRYAGVRANYPLRRRIPSLVYAAAYRLLFGLRCSDAMSGSFIMRRAVIGTISPLASDGFEAYLEMLAKARRGGASIGEVAVYFDHQTESGETSVLAKGPKQLLDTLSLWWRLRGSGADRLASERAGPAH
jgi:glycosyltransferase involved in cell wall biosynthesis